MPTAKAIWFHMWERTAHFVRRAWTIILGTSVLIWVLMATPVQGNGTFAHTDISSSAFGAVSEAVAPIFAPLGFGSWQASGALTTGLVAKEVVVSTMVQTYGVAAEGTMAEPTRLVADLVMIVTSFVDATIDTIKSIPLIIGINLFEGEAEAEPTALMQAVRDGFEQSSGGYPALAALAFMVFVLLYTPCMTAVAAARQELGNRWMWVSVIGQFVIAWLAAFLVFQVGRIVM